ncbi:MAG TPA: VOC family protein [Devosiaceae bacterium]
MPRPIHFEIHCADPERAMHFYGQLFGWEFQTYGGGGFDYWTIKTGEAPEQGIDGGLMRRMGDLAPENIAADSPVTAFVVTIGVDDIDAYLQKALALGGEVALPKGPVPGMGWVAYLKDTEANTFGLFQVDSSAA